MENSIRRDEMKRFPTPGGSSAAVIGAILLASVCAAENVVRNGSFEMLRPTRTRRTGVLRSGGRLRSRWRLFPRGSPEKTPSASQIRWRKKSRMSSAPAINGSGWLPTPTISSPSRGKGTPGSEIIMICGKSWTTRKTFAFTGAGSSSARDSDSPRKSWRRTEVPTCG